MRLSFDISNKNDNFKEQQTIKYQKATKPKQNTISSYD